MAIYPRLEHPPAAPVAAKQEDVLLAGNIDSILYCRTKVSVVTQPA